MGYRYYFYAIEKHKLEEVKKVASYKELEETYGVDLGSGLLHFYPPHLPMKKFYELGGSLNADEVERISESGQPLFNEILSNQLESPITEVGIEGLLTLIEIYKEKIISSLTNLLEDETIASVTPETRRKVYIADKLDTWTNRSPINLELNKFAIVNSTQYEYRIFELTSILKSIDVNKYAIIFTGH